MKKIICLAMAVILALSIAAFAESTSALDAFNALTGKQVQLGNPEKSNAEYLGEIMAGAYAAAPTDFISASDMAAELPYLTGITNRDIASFASANQYHVAQVRNAYYIALANVLRAEIMVNPASEARYQNVQVILSLFLETDETKVDHASREAIRNGMTPESAATIAAEYNLPARFVEFVIMDDNWDDDLWENDDDWRENTGWADDDLYEDSADDLAIGDRDSVESTRIADLQERLIALGYLTGKADGVFGPKTQAALMQYQLANGAPATGRFDDDDFDDMISVDVVARWDYDDSFDYDDSYDDSVDYDNSYDDSVDYDNSPDNSPDYDNSSDSSPDYDNSYDNSVDYDNSPDNSPDYDNSPDKPAATKRPVVQDSPDDSPNPTKKPTSKPAPKPAPQDSPDDSPDRDDSPDNSPDDSPDYEDS